MEDLERLKSGVPGLDLILGGGMVVGSSYIVQGRPGSGKTILANQIAFHQAGQGHKILFATFLAESHERLFQFLSTLSFFDPGHVGTNIQFVSALDAIETDGLAEVVTLLRREIGRQKATLLIVDGMTNIQPRDGGPLDGKRFIAELQGHASFAGCTVLFLTNSRIGDDSPELTMVDGIIEMGEDLIGGRSVRRMQLRKTRGSAALSGLHELEITRDGITIHPRLEAVFNYPSIADSVVGGTGRLESGIPTLDEMVGGGLPRASSTLMLGPSGCGKTTMGLAFLQSCTPQEPGILFGLYETPSRLMLKARSVGMALQPLVESGALHLVWQPPTERLLDALGHRLLDAVRTTGAKRVFIDSLSAIARSATIPGRSVAFFTSLMNELRARDVLVLASWEMRELFGGDLQTPTPELSGVMDNLLLMRFVELRAELRRVVSVLKVRDSAYDPSLRELVITDTGVALTKTLDQVAAIMSGSAQPPGRR